MPALLRRVRRAVVLPVLAVIVGLCAPLTAAHAESYVPISGSGSTWSFNALSQWARDVEQYGMRINFAANGSSAGRQDFESRQVEFAVSEIPYGVRDNGANDPPPVDRPFAYMPIVAGGTSFMYNLKIGGRRVTDLRLSGQTIAKIFTGVIGNWGDPEIKAENPGLALPARRIVPVVRSDGSGTSAQFTRWMANQFPDIWNAFCQKAGRATPCTPTSNYPNPGFLGGIAASGSTGVASYTAQEQNQGTITYVEYSYPRELGFPVVKVENAAHYFVSPTAQNVAVALLKARINDDKASTNYLTSILDDVYSDPDPRAYPLSSYSYMIIPTSTAPPMTTDKGRTLGAFAYYFLCQGQQRADDLGYSPLPINLVQAGLEQVRKIPGVNTQSIDIGACNNPTFSTNGTNTLAVNAPQPAACDKEGPSQCVGGAAAGGSPTGGQTPGATPAPGGPAVTTPPPGGSPSVPVQPSAGASGGLAPSRTSAAPGLAGTGPAAPGAQPPVDDLAPNAPPGALSAANVASSVPVTLGDSSVGDTGGTIVVAIALLLVLVVAPPVLGQALRRRSRS